MADIWVVVADASRARIFAAGTSRAETLVEVVDLFHPRSRSHARDLGADEPGSTVERAGNVHHGMAASTDPKALEAAHFAREVADRLDKDRRDGHFSRLYLIAAPAFLGELRKVLSPSTRALISAEIDHNLSTQDVAHIRAQLPDYL